MIEVRMQFNSFPQFLDFAAFLTQRTEFPDVVIVQDKGRPEQGEDVVDAEVIETTDAPPEAPPAAPAEVSTLPVAEAEPVVKSTHTQAEVESLLRRYGTKNGLAAAKAVLTEHGLGRLSDEGAEAQYDSLFTRLTALLA